MVVVVEFSFGCGLLRGIVWITVLDGLGVICGYIIVGLLVVGLVRFLGIDWTTDALSLSDGDKLDDSDPLLELYVTLLISPSWSTNPKVPLTFPKTSLLSILKVPSSASYPYVYEPSALTLLICLIISIFPGSLLSDSTRSSFFSSETSSEETWEVTRNNIHSIWKKIIQEK